MNCFRFPAGIARRRLVVFSVALAAALGGVAVAAAPASAEVVPGTCLDANAGEIYNTGGIAQWQCQTDDPFQSWKLGFVADSSDGPVYQVFNLGALEEGAADCLDADAQEVYDGGKIFQWGCNTADPYQLWIVSTVGTSTVTLQNYGALNRAHAADCLYAEPGEYYNGGQIVQEGCQSGDVNQEWELVPTVEANDLLRSFATALPAN